MTHTPLLILPPQQLSQPIAQGIAQPAVDLALGLGEERPVHADDAVPLIQRAQPVTQPVAASRLVSSGK